MCGSVVNSHTLELRQIRQLEAPVAAACGHNDGPAAGRFSVIERQRVRRAAGGKLGGGAGNADARPEFLGLNEGAAGEFLPRNPQGKSKIVLNPGTRSGLAARRVPLENQDIQAFRGPIHCRGQPARPRAHHNQVADLTRVNFVVQSEASGRLRVGRVAEGALAAADEDRNVGGRNAKLLEQRGHGRIGLDVKISMGMAVAGQEFAQPQGIARMGGSDQDGIAHRVRDQIHAALNKRIEERLPECNVHLHNLAKMNPIDFKHRAGVTGTETDQAPPA